jgi:hypothetical protein
MPYQIEKRGDMFEVVDADGKRVGEHPTRKQATAQLRALYASVPEAKEADEITLKNPGHGDQSVHGHGGNKSIGDKVTIKKGSKLGAGTASRDYDGAIDSIEKSESGESMYHVSFTDHKGKPRSTWRTESELTAKESSIVDRVLSFLKEGRRNSTNDASNLQQIHDLAVANGADCMFSIKEVNGAYRWVLLSSNSFQDTDREIVSLKALEADVARTDKEGGGNYGPLRWWHMGNPDPILRVAGAGVDIGTCDFRAMQGRTLIESGTFKDRRVALALKNRADDHLASIGFFHPMTEPDTHGVYSTIQIFERSVLPRLKASNQLTALTVKTKIGDIDMATMSEKWKEFVAVLGGDEALAKSVVKQAQDTEAQADSAGLKFKEGEAQAAPVVEDVTADEKAKKAAPKSGRKKGKGLIRGSSSRMRAMFARLDESGERTSAKAAKPGDETEEEDYDLDFEFEPDEIAEQIMPAIEKKMSEMIAASRKETTEKEAGLEAQIVALTAQLKEQQGVIMTLAGDMPRGVRNGYRASLAESTLTKKESPNQPQADPLGDMYSWMTNSLAGHPGA